METSEQKNKYYTPTIEEFHVGFEYEQASNKMVAPKQWFKETFYLNDSHIDIIKYAALDMNTRVKYLDKEDIESLGIPSYIDINHILGDTYEIIGTNARIFRGDIKNKSELKRILKQLNIENGSKI